MDEYLKKYDAMDRSVIFCFKVGNGGIGDLIKFFMGILYYCIKYDIKMYFANESNVGKYIKIRHPKMCIEMKDVLNPVPVEHVDHLVNLTPGISYTVEAGLFYGVFPFYQIPEFPYDIGIPMNTIFEFTDDVKQNQSIILTTQVEHYTSIHLRLGDKFLETDQNFVHCYEDERYYDPYKLHENVLNANGPVLFFCDNEHFKQQLKQQYDKVVVTTGAIGHTSLTNTTDKQTLDAVTEFYILTKSTHIVICSYSGFSIMASKFNNIPVTYLF
jgi:hypothetical protein